MQILECNVDPLQEESAEVMVIPVRLGDPRGAKIKPLLQGLQVPYVFTVWKQGSGKVSIVIPQEGHLGHMFGACYARTTKRVCIGVGGGGGSDSFGGHCRTPLHGGAAGKAS